MVGRTYISARRNGSATIGSWGVTMRWLVTADMGEIGQMDWMGSWWEGGGMEER